MIQPPRAYPFKKLEMKVKPIEDDKFEYAVYENGKLLSTRIANKGSYIACFIMKGYCTRYAYSICHLFSSFKNMGKEAPVTNPYAVGLIDGVVLRKRDTINNPGILKYFKK